MESREKKGNAGEILPMYTVMYIKPQWSIVLRSRPARGRYVYMVLIAVRTPFSYDVDQL